MQCAKAGSVQCGKAGCVQCGKAAVCSVGRLRAVWEDWEGCMQCGKVACSVGRLLTVGRLGRLL